MAQLPQAQHKTLVVGLGKTGLAVARFLARRGREVAVTDDRAEPPGLAALAAELPDVALFLGGYSDTALARADNLVVSPGVAAQDPFVVRARALGLPVRGDIELFAAAARAPIVGITGTNGKSTVTTMLGLMASAAGRDVRVGGNLGTPALDLIEATEPDLYVLELSSFQLELTDHLPLAAGAVLNVAPDHLDRYPDVAAYAAAKARLYYDAAISIVNRDDPRVVAMTAAKRRAVSFGLDAPAAGHYGLIDEWLAYGDEKLMPAADLKIPGRHNVANALAALALGAAVGLPRDAMLSTLAEFRGLPHRMSLVAERGGVAWYDDSKATNVGAAVAAIGGAGSEQGAPLVVIAGGDGKGQDFGAFAAALAGRARAVVLIGRDAGRIAAALGDAVAHEYAAGMDAAVSRAAELAQPGDRVLLAPACASFDMFANYEARGDAFAAAVRRLRDD